MDSLEWHEKLAADPTFKTTVLPAWRPDKAMNLEKPTYLDYIAQIFAGDIDAEGFAKGLAADLQ